jgi:hypothetical protein
MTIRTQGSAIEFSKLDFGTRLHMNVVQIRASIGVLPTRSITILKSDFRCTSSLENVRKTLCSEVWCTKLKVMSCYNKEVNPIVKLANDDAFPCNAHRKGCNLWVDHERVEFHKRQPLGRKSELFYNMCKLPSCLSTPSMNELWCQMPLFGCFQRIMNRLDFGKYMGMKTSWLLFPENQVIVHDIYMIDNKYLFIP